MLSDYLIFTTQSGEKQAKPAIPHYSPYPWIAAKQFNTETVAMGRKVIRHGKSKDPYHII